MSEPRPLLAVIPVRGGSKRLRRKWAAEVNGRPLLQHAIDCARAAEGIDRLVVCTEDPAVASYARLRGVEVLDRPSTLAADDVPLRRVARWVATETAWQGDLALLQATCPLLRPETLTAAIKKFRREAYDWSIAVAPEPHLFWQNRRPLTPRVNGQQIDPTAGLFRESGAVQIGTATFWRTGIGITTTFPIPADEALDIDTYADLEAARAVLGLRTIVFHVVASDEKGSGHLRRCLQLSDALAHHDVWWNDAAMEAWARHDAAGHGIRFAGNEPDLVVIDALAKAEGLTPQYATLGIPTVVFEPDGAPRARRFADLVFDEFDDPRWTILRPEFACLPPYDVRTRADRALVSFGGTDPTGMNERVSRILQHGADLTELEVAAARTPGSMAEKMRRADLVITSQGRTVHEAAAVGVPCLSIAVNERESRHAQLPGVVYLGLAHTLSDAAILDAVNRLLGSPAIRAEMSRTASQAIDGKGLRRVVRKIEDLLEGLV